MSETGATIIRVERTRNDPFARVPKEILEDPTLSWRAKGILAYLLGKPNDWQIRTGDIIKRSTEGREAVRKAFRELKLAGYARLVANQTADGRVAGRQWVISDSPFDRQTEKPSFGSPNDRQTDCRSIGRTNKKEKSTKKEEETLSLLVEGTGRPQPNAFRDRFAAIYKRRAATKWSADEEKAWLDVWQPGLVGADAWIASFDDDLRMVERYYAANRLKKDSICRTNLLRLLRHWAGEVDRAQAWCERNPLRSSRTLRAEPVYVEPPPLAETEEEKAKRLDFERRFAEHKARRNGSE